MQFDPSIPQKTFVLQHINTEYEFHNILIAQLAHKHAIFQIHIILHSTFTLTSLVLSHLFSGMT